MNLLAPGSTLHDLFFDGSISGYAQELVGAMEADVAEIQTLRSASLATDWMDVYDQIAEVQAALTADAEQLSWGRYMSPSRLARWLVEQVDLGATIGDTAAGVGTIVAMARRAAPAARPVGIELSNDLVALGRLAQLLTTGSSDYSWCRQGDLFDWASDTRVDSLILSPPWVLRENLPSATLSRFASHPVYGPLATHELFDICVPFVVESAARSLHVGGSFVAALPLRVTSAPEWRGFRSGELFHLRGMEVEMEFRDAPREHLDAYPARFVVVVGVRRA